MKTYNVFITILLILSWICLIINTTIFILFPNLINAIADIFVIALTIMNTKDYIELKS